jgi:glycosyltransferase involved in cell wall biosynthesis
MSLRIGVVAGTDGAEIGGGWTLATTLIETLKNTQFKHEFLFVDKFLRPASPSGSSGLRHARVGASVALILLQQSLRSYLERNKNRTPGIEHTARILRVLANFAGIKHQVLSRHPNAAGLWQVLFDGLQEQLLDYLGRTDVMMPEYLQQTALECLERTIQREKLDLIWYMVPNALPVSVPFIATVLDLEHRKQPYFPEVSLMDWTWTARESNYCRLLPRSAFILTGTEQGKMEVVDYYRVNPALVKVIPFPTPTSFFPCASSAVEAIKKKYGVTGDFLLYPAQFWPHKNHINLLLGLDVLRREYDLRPSLVLTGSDKGNRDYVRKLVRELHLSEQVFDLGFVSREELTCLYAGASALVYPSFFGPDNLPPLEALASGCPAAVADVPGAREQLGRGALYFNPSDPDQIAAKICQVLRSEDCRQKLIDEGIKISRQRTPHSYISAVCDMLDGFEPIRRCWGQLAPIATLTNKGLSFARGGNGVVALREGWGQPEDWGTWSVQERCILRFNLGEFTGQPLSIKFACRVFQYRNLQVGCYVEGGPIQRWSFAMPPRGMFAIQEAKEPCRLSIDPEVIPPSGDLSITFVIPDSASPAELGLSADDRRLVIGLERMWVANP